MKSAQTLTKTLNSKRRTIKCGSKVKVHLCSTVLTFELLLLLSSLLLFIHFILFSLQIIGMQSTTLLLFVYAIHVFRSFEPRTDCSVSECLLLPFLSHFIWSFKWLGILNVLMIQRHFSTCNWITCSLCKVLHGRQWRRNGYDTTISYSNLDTTFLFTERLIKRAKWKRLKSISQLCPIIINGAIKSWSEWIRQALSTYQEDTWDGRMWNGHFVISN